MQVDYEAYKSHLVNEELRIRTIINYLSTLRNHEILIPQNESKEESLRVNELLKKETKNTAKVIRSYIKFKYNEEVSKQIKDPKEKKKRDEEKIIKEKHLTEKEVNILLSDETIEFILKLYISMAFDMAGRGTETLNLRFKDINFDYDKELGGFIVNLKENNNERDVIKRGHPRDVVLSQRSINLLKEYMKQIKVNDNSNLRIFKDFYTRDIDKLDEETRAIERSNVIKRLNEKLTRASMDVLGKPITSHWFRHSALTDMAVNGVGLLDIMEYAGHSDPNITMNYIRASGVLSRKAWERWKEKKS